MMTMKALITISILTLLMNTNPMTILINICFISLLLAKSFNWIMNLNWMGLIIIMIFSSGLLILFLFLISLTPSNNYINHKITILMLMWLFMMNNYFNMNSSSNFNCFKMILPTSWQTMTQLTFIILMILFLTIKLILNPNTRMKTTML